MNLNEIRAALVIPEGTGRDLRRGRTAPVQVLINGDNANTATTVMGYAVTIVRSVSAELVASATERPTPPLSLSFRASGTTPSSGARCSSCLASSPTSR